MRSLFQRVFKRLAGQPSSPGMTERRQPTESVEAQAMGPVALGARRPLISARGEVVGFEFRVPVATQARLQRKTDQLAQAAHLAGVLASAKMVTQFGRTGLARVPADWVMHGGTLSVGPGMLIALESSPSCSADDW
jgi:EAL and modified HD-GYP domain-containing signal transduction protein